MGKPIQFIVMVFLIATFISGCVNQERNFPRIELDENEFIFGTVNEGQEVVHDFKVKNSGTTELRIIGIRKSGSQFHAEPFEFKIQPGESTLVRARLNTDSLWGDQSYKFFIDSNDPLNIETLVILKGMVKSPLSMDTPNISASAADRKSHYLGVGEIINTSDKPLVITNAVGSSENVKVAPGPPAKFPITLGPGKKANILVDVTPDPVKRFRAGKVALTLKNRDRPFYFPIKAEPIRYQRKKVVKK